MFRSEVHPSQAIQIGMFDNTVVQDLNMKQKDLYLVLKSMRYCWYDFGMPQKFIGALAQADVVALDNKERFTRFQQECVRVMDKSKGAALPGELEKVSIHYGISFFTSTLSPTFWMLVDIHEAQASASPSHLMLITHAPLTNVSTLFCVILVLYSEHVHHILKFIRRKLAPPNLILITRMIL